MNLSHDQRLAAHGEIVPLLEDGQYKEANAVARRYAGDDWDELIDEARAITFDTE